MHVNNNHWIAASTLNLNCSKANITIYDSMNSSVSIQTKNILAKLLKTNEDSFTIQLAKVNKQSGTDDCGVFVSAYCTSLAFGQDPSSVVYDQGKLREHLVTCLENTKMTLFPTIRARRTASCYVSVDVYCTCRCPYTGEQMVACDNCKNWYHIECLEMLVKKTQKWYCKNCLL